jgi:hypothetical protein
MVGRVRFIYVQDYENVVRFDMDFKYVALSGALVAGFAFAGESGDVGHHSAPVEAVEHDAGASGEEDFTGFYAGGGGGFDNYTVKAGKTSKSPVAFGPVAVIGYGYTMPENRLYLGGEADVAIKVAFAREGYKANPFMIGGSFRIGYDFSNVPLLVGGLIGFENHGVSAKPNGEKIDVSGRMTAIRMGLFGSYKIGDGWHVRADLFFTFSSSKKQDNKDKTDKTKNAVKSVDLEGKKWGLRVMGVYTF